MVTVEKRPQRLGVDNNAQKRRPNTDIQNSEPKKKKLAIQTDVHQRKPPKLETQSRPKSLSLLIPDLNPRQKQDIRDIGFGGLLELHIRDKNMSMMRWFLDNFDPASRWLTVNGKDGMYITDTDVRNVIDLPYRTGIEVREVPIVRKGLQEEEELINRWKAEFDIGKKEYINYDDFAKKLKDMKDGGPKFKRLFVMFVVSTFLAPRGNRHLNLSIVRAIEDVDEIVKQDWCEWIMKKIVEAALFYHNGGKGRGDEGRGGESEEEQATQEKGESKTLYLNGCLTVIQIAYFHKYHFQGKIANREIPWIQHWDHTSISQRILNEKKSKNKVKLGVVEAITPEDAIFRKPIGETTAGLETATSHAERPSESGSVSQAAQRAPAKRKQPMDISTEGKKILSYELTEKYISDKAIDALPLNGPKKRWMKMGRNLEVVLTKEIAEAKSLREEIIQIRQQSQKTDSQGIEGDSPSSVYDDCLNEEFDGMIADMIQLNERLRRVGALQIQIPPPNEPDPPEQQQLTNRGPLTQIENVPQTSSQMGQHSTSTNCPVFSVPAINTETTSEDVQHTENPSRLDILSAYAVEESERNVPMNYDTCGVNFNDDSKNSDTEV